MLRQHPRPEIFKTVIFEQVMPTVFSDTALTSQIWMQPGGRSRDLQTSFKRNEMNRRRFGPSISAVPIADSLSILWTETSLEFNGFALLSCFARRKRVTSTTPHFNEERCGVRVTTVR